MGSTSPAFILGTTMYSYGFISYTGEALDYKTPLLRALQVMDDAATEVCKYFDKKRESDCNPRLGAGVFLNR
jgi:glutamine synthetase